MKGGRRPQTRDPDSPYPPFVCTEDERRRWDLAAQIVERVFGDLGPVGSQMATGAVYRSDWPTDDP